MSRFGDNWAISYRNTRAIFAAVGLAMILIWALALKKQEDARTFLQTDTVKAIITDIKKIESDSRFGGKNITYITHLALPESKNIRFMLLQSPPKIGSEVPVLIDMYDDGSKYYHYNQMDWQLLKTQ